MTNKNKDVQINYKLHFDPEPKDFNISLNSNTLDLIPEDNLPTHDWMALDFEQCPNCPLDKEQHPLCPIAKNIPNIVDFFAQAHGRDQIKVEVQVKERTYEKVSNVAPVAISIIGIYMVTCGCPIMDKLRPMVRFHLPFATMEDTIYRSVSMHLMAQYFLAKKGKEPDWELKDLSTTYQNVGEVNAHFYKRLKAASSLANSVLSAITSLDSYAYYINLSLSGKHLYDLENLFKDYT